MSLKTQLDDFQQDFRTQAPEAVLNIMDQASSDLETSGISNKALAVGQQLPDTTLPDHEGKPVNLYALLEKGPLIINFYRGGWCPYCNLELKAYIDQLDAIRAHGAQLIAITPEQPDASAKTIDSNGVTFPILSDQHGEYGRQLGLIFTLPEAVRSAYEGFGIDLEAHNGSGSFELPLPATYIIDTDGKVSYAFVSTDYTQRAEPSHVIAALAKLATPV